jgi:hypothetical protein
MPGYVLGMDGWMDAADSDWMDVVPLYKTIDCTVHDDRAWSFPSFCCFRESNEIMWLMNMAGAFDGPWHQSPMMAKHNMTPPHPAQFSSATEKSLRRHDQWPKRTRVKNFQLSLK